MRQPPTTFYDVQFLNMRIKKTPIYSIFILLIITGMLLSCGRNYVNWWEHYSPDSKDPYGTFLVRHLLASYYPGEPFKVLEDNEIPVSGNGNYVFIGSGFWLDSIQTNSLLRFVREGNQAFISSNNIPYFLLDSISKGECLELTDYEDSLYVAETDNFYKDSLVTLNFEHPDLKDSTGYPCRFLYDFEPQPYTWSYFQDDFFCEGQTVFASLGRLDSGQVCFVKATYGEGAFYFHTVPLALTNYYLKEEKGLEYAGKVFSHLSPGPVYWDQREQSRNNFSRNRSLADESPLKYILSQPSLAWAWYVLLGMAVFYLIFRAKRRQRIIPVLEQNTNTSLEFIGTIGRLFFLQNNHKQLALQKMKLFLGFVRDRYHLSTKELDDIFTKNLATRSEVPEDAIGKILMLHRNINSSSYVSENILVDFHRMVEDFYKRCK
jgi:hypothetical protein